jgi:hypothetical protein
MRLPVPLPVLGMLLPPLAGALQAGFGVLGIAGQFLRGDTPPDAAVDT